MPPSVISVGDFDFSKYQSKITEILSNLSSSDLFSITAKQLRKLIQGEFNIDLSKVKKEFDEAAVEHFQKYLEFKELSKTFSSVAGSQAESSNTYTKTSYTMPVAVKEEKVKQEHQRYQSDALIEENQEDLIEPIGEFDYLPHRLTRGSKSSKKATVKVKKPRSSPTCILSPELAEICGKSEIPKNVISKSVWEYIKSKDLQDPNNKQYINCDEKLQKVCKTDRMYMFHLSRLLNPHITVLKKEKKYTHKVKSEDGVEIKGEKEKGKKSKFNKLHHLSASLQEIVGCEQDSRPQVTQKLWKYIKENNLQGKFRFFILKD